ncbi:MAG: lytic transglycosylase domain-containing protein [Sphingomonas sp.]|jgi:soluble lytic murein transglycosylase
MVAPLFRSGLLAAAASWLAASSVPVQDQLDQLRGQLQQLPASSDASNALSAAIAQWKQLQQSPSLSFDSYATFLLAHPGWPNEASLRKSAERALDSSAASPSVVVSFFHRYPPLTTAGQVRFAEALSAVGQTSDANATARAAWVQGTLSPADEGRITAEFSTALTSADQDARMDALLWKGATTPAARQLALVSADKRDLFAARLAFRTNAADAAGRAAATADRFGRDPGYVADRAIWLRSSGQSAAAREWLAQARNFDSRPANPQIWIEVLRANARGAANDGQASTALGIARQVDAAYAPGTEIALRPYGERDAYTDVVWLGGQVAMKQLARPADAVGMFERYSGGSTSPSIRAKGLYWAGRAAEAAGQKDRAADYFKRAAQMPDQFYGQLALEHLGRPLQPPPDVVASPASQAERDAFYASELVRAARYLGTTGAHEDQTAFVRQIAQNAKSETDHVLAIELSRTLGRPDLGVMVGRSALKNGLTDYAATGFPSVAVPEGQADAWTMIHAIARQESQFDRAAVSHAGARGLMQLMPGTAREVAGKLGVSYDSTALTRDTGYNIQLGSSYFQKLYTYYGSYPLAVAAYNAGPGNVNKWLTANGDPRMGGVDMIDWIEAIPLYETRNYVQRVLENAVVYDLLNPQHSRSSGSTRLSWYLGRRPG